MSNWENQEIGGMVDDLHNKQLNDYLKRRREAEDEVRREEEEEEEEKTDKKIVEAEKEIIEWFKEVLKETICYCGEGMCDKLECSRYDDQNKYMEKVIERIEELKK